MIRYRGALSGILMALFIATWYEMGLTGKLTLGRGAFFEAMVPLWLVLFCPAWALLLPAPRARLWWAVAGGAVFWSAEALRAGVATGTQFYAEFSPAGWPAAAWGGVAAAVVYGLNSWVARSTERVRPTRQA